MNFGPEATEIEFDFPLLAADTGDALADHNARARTDYESWKRNLLTWLSIEGKDPDRLRGYSEDTVRNTNYKVDQVMRWLWNQRGYTMELTTEDADSLMRELGVGTASTRMRTSTTSSRQSSASSLTTPTRKGSPSSGTAAWT